VDAAIHTSSTKVSASVLAALVHSPILKTESVMSAVLTVSHVYQTHSAHHATQDLTLRMAFVLLDQIVLQECIN